MFPLAHFTIFDSITLILWYFCAMANISTDLSHAIELLKSSELVAIPTETVYGLAANALDPKAVIKIFEAKKRPEFDPLIVHIGRLDDLLIWSLDLPPKLLQIAEQFWPGPLTILSKKNPLIPDLVTSGLDTVGIRMPNHPLTLALLQQLDFPLAAPSANPFGYISPTSPEHVNTQLGEKIELILDGGHSEVGVESTIIALEDNVIRILRQGGITVQDLTGFGIPVIANEISTSKPSAPGQLISHYAPRKPMLCGNIASFIAQNQEKKYAVLAFSQTYHAPIERILSANGDVSEAAQNLFRMMRELDQSEAEVIYCELVPQEGIGAAVNDRIKRASQH
jgi:L-threonylcarbamoyladenylate synthase